MISIIVAVAENGVIGGDNRLLWHISEDLRRFRSLTTGHPVVMGRKTYESLGRPLPNRTNVVVTRQRIEIPGCRVVHSFDEAAALFGADEELFVIGGAQIYAEALPRADRFYLTRVGRAYEGDTLFPRWDEEAWRLVESESFPGGRENPHPCVSQPTPRRRRGGGRPRRPAPPPGRGTACFSARMPAPRSGAGRVRAIFRYLYSCAFAS